MEIQTYKRKTHSCHFFFYTLRCRDVSTYMIKREGYTQCVPLAKMRTNTYVLTTQGAGAGDYYKVRLPLDFTLHENSSLSAPYAWCALLGRILKFYPGSAGKNETIS